MNTCESCRFCCEEGINKETMRKHYTCRRFPPLPQMIPNQGGIATISNFPGTQTHLWCGEFASALAVTN